jgi:hypothetical protein
MRRAVWDFPVVWGVSSHVRRATEGEGDLDERRLAGGERLARGRSKVLRLLDGDAAGAEALGNLGVVDRAQEAGDRLARATASGRWPRFPTPGRRQ